MRRAALATLAGHSLRHHSCRPAPVLYRRALASHRAFSMSGNTQHSSSSSKDDATAPATDRQKQQGLPAPGEGTPITLDVSGDGSTVKLSELGPLVVNVDGTVARISNWKEMTDAERETTVRMVGRRNKQRLEALKKSKAAEEEGRGESGAQ
ncbi:fungal specific transcription factor [Cordyceps javanica]|uniref:Fungal specific transcription factor n=1 Tax=Cordyceps javanica TaxID=43265 RepID=A0A545UXH1_9HYPO|nr:fungal specific transcription factor [Cordyceps javanica]TQW06039.1 fungal specific transcription factor [Cordyceps javanica]